MLHHHPNNSAASPANLAAAAWLDAEHMLIVNPDGTVHRHQKIDGEIVELEPLHNPDFAAPVDPLETVAHSIAYAIQSLLEIGNPAEMVMRQDAPLWWQEENIIVPYRTDETVEEVASRMIGPPPDPVRDEDNYAELLKEHLKDSAEFTSYLKRLNQSNTEPNVMYIPMPGWSARKEHTPRGAKIMGSHASRRTFMRTLPYSIQSPRNLGVRWNRLSPVEQRIEMALTSTADDAVIAIFDNIQSVDSAFRWIEDNNDLIEKYATNASIPKELLQVILASEILYDYGTNDSIQDIMGRAKLTTDISWRGPGVGNVHYVTLMDAYIHLDKLNQADIWQLDPDAPDWSSFYTLEEFTLPDTMTPAQYNTMQQHDKDSIKFVQREGRYSDLDFYSEKNPFALYTATDEGTINAASVVTRMFLDQYLGLDDSRTVENLSAEDYARIWGRYRTAQEDLAHEEYGPNATLAYPIAEYFLGQI